jgi:hypothetical protein
MESQDVPTPRDKAPVKLLVEFAAVRVVVVRSININSHAARIRSIDEIRLGLELLQQDLCIVG